MVLPLSLQRMDRLPFHFDRWDGDYSIALQMKEEEMKKAAGMINRISKKNVRFSLYIIEAKKKVYRCTFRTMKQTISNFSSCFDINVLRNLAIETILTSHYLLTDGDAVISCVFFIVHLLFYSFTHSLFYNSFTLL